MNKLTTMLPIAVLVLSGCAGMMPTYKTEDAFAIFDVKGDQINRNAFLGDVTKAIQENMSSAQINRSIPETDLPDKAPRFKLTNPFAGTAMGAMMGGGVKVPSCEQSLMTVNSADSSMQQSGESTSLYLCVQQYKAGYQLSIYVSHREATGGFSPQLLGATMAKAFTGGSSQFIPRTINAVKTAAGHYGTITLVDSYIPDSFKGAFYDGVSDLSKR